jgi:hypothetical protein
MHDIASGGRCGGGAWRAGGRMDRWFVTEATKLKMFNANPINFKLPIFINRYD